MAMKSIFSRISKKSAGKGRNVEHLCDLRIVTRGFTLINGEAEFQEEPRRPR